jgi:hypothetical protein
MARLRRSGRAAGDRGAVLVEATFVLPVVLLIIFGIIECGYLFRSASVVNSASRSGARLASASYASAPDKAAALDEVRKTVEQDLAARGSDDSPLDLWIYRANAQGFPQGTSDFRSCPSDCARFRWSGNGFVSAGGTWASPDACGKFIDNVGVYVNVAHTPFANGILGPKTIGEKTVMRLEPRSDCVTAE